MSFAFLMTYGMLILKDFGHDMNFPFKFDWFTNRLTNCQLILLRK